MNSRQKYFSIGSKALFTIVGGAVLINPAFAQEQAGEELEEVVVTGLRGSLQASRDIKRDSVGVVDAISAEDIGKFPDSNLSESLQRITGISIDRRDGEGAEVTARGFGAQYNLITLNGRAMPAADAFGNMGGSSRSFNFANLASESISGVEVYKTSKANISTGGIGATINIKTARPLDSDQTVANVGVKVVNDSTNRVGDDFTPEVSGIFSYANDDKTWGVGLSASYQKRDSGASGAYIFDWNIRTWHNDLEEVNNNTRLSRDPGTGLINANISHAPAEGQLYGIPSDMRYTFMDTERERINGQLTLQFAPTDSLVLTGDFTYANNQIKEDGGEQTTWMNADGFRLIEFDTGRAVATPVTLEEDERTGKDFSFAQQHFEQENTLKSAGFNAAWEASDDFKLALDVHNSKMESMPNDPTSGAGQISVALGARVASNCDVANTPPPCTNRMLQTFHFNNGLPIASRTLFPELTSAAPTSGGDPQYVFSQADLGSQVLQIFYQDQTTEITQARVDGELGFGENGALQFGVETRSMEMTEHHSGGSMTLGDWGIKNRGEFPEGLLQPFSLINQFDDFGTAGAPIGGFKGNAVDIAKWAVGAYGDWNEGSMTDGVLAYNPAFDQNNDVQEDTRAAYFQFKFNGELGTHAIRALLGVRYEHTDVTSISALVLPTNLVWQDNNDFRLDRGTEETPFKQGTTYDHVLPSLDFDFDITEGLKARFSYSKTIARAQYNQLRSSVTVGTPQGSTGQGNIAGASGSNPALVPLESDNLDLSLEWYFGQSSYLSVGFFDKRVSNFIGDQVSQESLFGIRDQTSGPRAQAAMAALTAGGYAINDDNLFTLIAMTEHGIGAQFDGTPGQHQSIAALYDILPAADDPLYQFNVSRPVNNKEANLYGAEIAGQHFFGDSGFGVQANYTIVNGDVAFNDAGDPSVNQFALLGLSDSANAILMYEKFGVSARLAYNWRDEFLRDINRGNGKNPGYVEAYDQIDFNVGYQVNDHLAVSFEAINLTGEDLRTHARSVLQMWDVADLGPRYTLGARYKF